MQIESRQSQTGLVSDRTTGQDTGRDRTLIGHKRGGTCTFDSARTGGRARSVIRLPIVAHFPVNWHRTTPPDSSVVYGLIGYDAANPGLTEQLLNFSSIIDGQWPLLLVVAFSFVPYLLSDSLTLITFTDVRRSNAHFYEKHR